VAPKAERLPSSGEAFEIGCRVGFEPPKFVFLEHASFSSAVSCVPYVLHIFVVFDFRGVEYAPTMRPSDVGRWIVEPEIDDKVPSRRWPTTYKTSRSRIGATNQKTPE